MVKNGGNCSGLQTAFFLIFAMHSCEIAPELRATYAGYWEGISR